MIARHIFLLIALNFALLATAQEAAGSREEYLRKINKELPHQFKELKTGATMEAIRDQGVVKIYLLVDDIEQYEELLIERSDELQTNFSQCKSIAIEKGKYKKNYVEVTDQYPLSLKMGILYRLKVITSEGITKMFAPVSVTSKL